MPRSRPRTVRLMRAAGFAWAVRGYRPKAQLHRRYASHPTREQLSHAGDERESPSPNDVGVSRRSSL